MSATLLSAGLLGAGALGFALGARPEIVLCLHPEARRLAPERARAAVDLLYPLAAAFFAGFVFSTLVPDALAHSRASLAAFAAGLAGMALLARKVLKRDPCCEGGHEHAGIGAASVAAMAVCSVNDGLLLGLLQPAWTSGLNLGMLLHKVTASFAIAQVLLRSGFRGRGLALFGAAYVAVSPLAFLGAALPAVARWPGTEILSAASAGVLAYVSLSSLAPHAVSILRRRPAVLAGFAAALLLSLGLGAWHRALHRHGGPGDAYGGDHADKRDAHDGHGHGHADGHVPRGQGEAGDAAPAGAGSVVPGAGPGVAGDPRRDGP